MVRSGSAQGAPYIHLVAAPEDSGRVAPMIARLGQRGFITTMAWPVSGGPPAPLLTLVAVAPASNRAPAVRDIAARAIAAGARVTPLILTSRGDMPDYLAQKQWVDFSGPFESGWFDLLAALDRAGVTGFPPASGLFDWELALARAYRGLLPAGWRAYRATPRYYLWRFIFTLSTTLLAIPTLMLALGFLTQWPLAALWDKLPNLGVSAQEAVGLFTIAILISLGIVIFQPARVALQSAARREDRSEIIVFSPDGFVLRTREGTVVQQFRELAAIEQIADPPRRRSHALTDDAGPEAGFRLLLGQTAGALRLRHLNGQTQIVALGDRFPNRALIAQQLIRAFTARQESLAQPGGAPASPTSSVAPVFISHARKDRVAVDRLDEMLRLAGYQTWVDRSRLAGGEDWSRELGRAIATCRVVVVVISPASLASPVVREEYETALRLGKPVLAVLLRDSRAIPDVLTSRRCADIRRGGEALWRQGWAPLLLALERAHAPFADPTAFNAHMTLAHALVNKPRPEWRLFHPTPLGREPSLYLGLAFALLPPLIATGIALALRADWLIVAGIITLGLFFCEQVSLAIYQRYHSLWLLVVTPGGTALLRAGDLDSYAWVDYDGARVAERREPGGIVAGAVLLRQRATGRDRRVGGLEVFTPLDPARAAVLASFQAYRARRPNG